MQQPTKAMIDFFERRTTAHIQTVNYVAGLLPVPYSFPDHDKSKFKEPERTAYTILTEEKRGNFTPDKDTAAQIKIAVKYHYAHNPHHPNYYKNVKYMRRERLVEAVCDWYAMHIEIHYFNIPTDFKTVYEYYAKCALPKYDFSCHQKDIMERTMKDIHLASLEFPEIFNNKIKKIWDNCR